MKSRNHTLGIVSGGEAECSCRKWHYMVVGDDADRLRKNFLDHIHYVLRHRPNDGFVIPGPNQVAEAIKETA